MSSKSSSESLVSRELSMTLDLALADLVLTMVDWYQAYLIVLMKIFYIARRKKRRQNLTVVKVT